MLSYDDCYSNEAVPMSRPNPEARQRLVTAAADMLRRRGLNATSVRELAKYAKAPLGSTYHYFPGGKPQLVTEAIQFVGAGILRAMRRELAAGPVAGLRAFLVLWRETLIGSDFGAGCPVLAVAAEEASGDGTISPLAAAAEVFASWETLLADSLQQHGTDRQEAESLATLIVAAVEGAIVMCRAQHSPAALDRVALRLEALVAAAVGVDGGEPPQS